MQPHGSTHNTWITQPLEICCSWGAVRYCFPLCSWRSRKWGSAGEVSTSAAARGRGTTWMLHFHTAVCGRVLTPCQEPLSPEKLDHHTWGYWSIHVFTQSSFSWHHQSYHDNLLCHSLLSLSLPDYAVEWTITSTCWKIKTNVCRSCVHHTNKHTHTHCLPTRLVQ